VSIIKAVVFDMYETLITVFDQRPYYSAEMAKDVGVTTASFRRYWRSYEEARTLGRCDLTEALSGTLSSLGIRDEAILHQMVMKRLADQRRIFASIHPGILAMLETLKARGVKIGLISNCYPEERDCIRVSALAPYFDAMVLSCEQGIRKPDAEIFRRCLRALDVSADEALYIGDGGSMELESAASCGMHVAQACWFLREDEPDQPCGRKPDFPQINTPEGIEAFLG